jgi:hypothetical protein
MKVVLKQRASVPCENGSTVVSHCAVQSFGVAAQSELAVLCLFRICLITSFSNNFRFKFRGVMMIKMMGGIRNSFMFAFRY